MTVVIVDDSPDFRAVAALLLRDAGFVVVGEAGAGSAALEMARAQRPDLMLIDVQLPDMSGLAVADALRQCDPPPQVVLTSENDLPARARRRAGHVLGFIQKSDFSGPAFVGLVAPFRSGSAD